MHFLAADVTIIPVLLLKWPYVRNLGTEFAELLSFDEVQRRTSETPRMVMYQGVTVPQLFINDLSIFSYDENVKRWAGKWKNEERLETALQ